MRTDNIVQMKSYDFAIRIVNLYQYLIREKVDRVLGRQVLRCGTSIGANVEEALGAQTRKDLYSKMCIAYKETREIHYWLRLLRDTKKINAALSTSIIKDVEELQRIIGSIQKTMKKNS